MNGTVDFMEKWSGIMSEDELAEVERSFRTGEYLTFEYEGRDEAIAKMHYIYKNGPLIKPYLFCEYPDDVDLDPVDAGEDDDFSREELLALMSTGSFKSCTLMGDTIDDESLQAAVIWDIEDGCDSGWLYLVVYGDRPYTDIEIRLADMLNTPMYP